MVAARRFLCTARLSSNWGSPAVLRSPSCASTRSSSAAAVTATAEGGGAVELDAVAGEAASAPSPRLSLAVKVHDVARLEKLAVEC